MEEKIITQKYLKLSKQLSKIIYEVNDGFCQNSCPTGDIGCCQCNVYSAGSNSELKKIQESILVPKKSYQNHKISNCEYHTKESGCILNEAKPPLCLGYICFEYLEELLLKSKESEKINQFYELLEDKISFGSLTKNPNELLENISSAIKISNSIINSKNNNNYTNPK